MLRQLAIHNVVLVDRLELEFEPGLGVLTGETGAGKSILLDALGLALGARADVGPGSRGRGKRLGQRPRSRCRDDHPARELLHGQGIEPGTGEPLVVRRTLKSDGGSRAFFIAGTAAPAGLLRDLGSLAVDIDGQHDDPRPARQLQGPPRRSARRVRQFYGGHRRDAWAEVSRIEAELGQARAGAAAAERDREWLEHAYGGNRTARARGG